MAAMKDSSDELASMLLSESSFVKIYIGVEKLAYGLDQRSLADLIRKAARKMAERSEKSVSPKVEGDLYDPGFYEWVRVGAQRSARAIVPLLIQLIHPRSVVDLGCGDGTWLSIFMEHGVESVRGIDGPWVDQQRLAIPKQLFRAVDLRTFVPRSDESYDLVFSAECAEHLEEEHAVHFVQSLCKMGHVICFSAAVPFQGGIGHVNEQWPEYWASRFKDNGYFAADWIRPKVWSNPEVESWYAQNMLIFADSEFLQRNPELAKCSSQTDADFLTRIHPTHFLKAAIFLLPQMVRQGIY